MLHLRIASLGFAPLVLPGAAMAQAYSNSPVQPAGQNFYSTPGNTSSSSGLGEHNSRQQSYINMGGSDTRSAPVYEGNSNATQYPGGNYGSGSTINEPGSNPGGSNIGPFR